MTLVVIAHPDNESLGLGSVLAAAVDAGTRVAALCFAHGEAPTLSATGADPHQTRAVEPAGAAGSPGSEVVGLLAYPDGRLAQTAVEELAERVVDAAHHHAELLVVSNDSRMTGHPDRQGATEATLPMAGGFDLPVVGWAVPDEVTAALNAEFATAFVGRTPYEMERRSEYIPLPVC